MKMTRRELVVRIVCLYGRRALALRAAPSVRMRPSAAQSLDEKMSQDQKITLMRKNNKNGKEMASWKKFIYRLHCHFLLDENVNKTKAKLCDILLLCLN